MSRRLFLGDIRLFLDEIHRLADSQILHQLRSRDGGLEAGRILAKLHSIPAPIDALDWESRFNAKIDRKIVAYENCELKYVILDKDVVLQPGTKLIGTPTRPIIIKRGEKI